MKPTRAGAKKRTKYLMKLQRSSMRLCWFGENWLHWKSLSMKWSLSKKEKRGCLLSAITLNSSWITSQTMSPPMSSWHSLSSSPSKLRFSQKKRNKSAKISKLLCSWWSCQSSKVQTHSYACTVSMFSVSMPPFLPRYSYQVYMYSSFDPSQRINHVWKCSSSF